MFDMLFKTKAGDIVLGQPPNAPIIIAALCYALSWLNALHLWEQELRILSLSFLFIWSYLELAYGINTFRKILGGISLVIMTVFVLLSF